MKRCREKEEDLLELLQLLDDEVEGPSSDGDNHREQELEPKHKIFLSHSGFQKDFTEQLCIDLERCQYYPFFDKRPDSLPKGRRFPELILQAAQQCQVAVLILSEDFFMRTKWPMLELEAFVEAQKKDPKKISILPVYLGISRHECTKDEGRCSAWVGVWRKWAESEDRIDVDKWVEALRVLGPSNGIEYVQSLGEVRLREQIMRAIRDLVRPEIIRSVGQIEGRTRICKAIIEKFRSTKPSPVYGVCIVGLYGMGGVGKSTFCKVLCDELSRKFEGKVCHGELGMKIRLELEKQVLRELTDVNHGSLTRISNEATITKLLRQGVRQQEVFLALDNVWLESLEEAKAYLRMGFHDGSIVMVTARSIDVLTCLNIDRSDCLEMPELEEEDAIHLFLQSSGFQLQSTSDDDEQQILQCVRHCKFGKGANMDEHFHPLALKVLGAQLGSLGLDPKMWVENLSKGDKFNRFGEREHPVFSVLRRGYDSLLEEDQLLFMDSILFYPRVNCMIGYCHYFLRLMDEDDVSIINIFEWLSIVHRTEVWKIKDRLHGLKAKSLLEDIGDGSNGVSVHDLYLEFVKLEVRRGALGRRRWVWFDKEISYPIDLVIEPSGRCWENVERVAVQWKGSIEGIKWQHFSNVVVLHLRIGANEVLDLRGLRVLRSLDLQWGHLFSNDIEGKLMGLGELRNLGWLSLFNIHYALCIEEIGHLTLLEVLWLKIDCGSRSGGNCGSEPLSPPKLDKCIHLRELVLQECKCLKAFPDLSRLRSLTRVIFDECGIPNQVVGLNSQMSKLHQLLLIDCSSLCHIHGLGDLVALQKLCIVEWKEGLKLPSFHKLTNLQRLLIRGKFHEVLGFSEAMSLQVLIVAGLVHLPDLHLLRNLRRLDFESFPGSMLPQFGNFTTLEELRLDFMPEVRELPDMHKLSMLRRLRIQNADKLELQLLMFGDLVALEELMLKKCGTSMVVKAELRDLQRLTNLQVLELYRTPIRSLPGLEHLTQLRNLDCSETKLVELPDLTDLKLLESINLSWCHELTSLDNLANLPALESINLSGCHELTSLGNLANVPALQSINLYGCHELTSLDNLANLPALESIDLSGCHELTSLGNLANLPRLKDLIVSGCYRVQRLPDLTSFKRLKSLILCYSGIRLSSEDIMGLATLSVRRLFICDHFRLKFLKMLEKMPLTEVVMKIEAKQLEFFATAQTTDSYITDPCKHSIFS